MATRQRAKGSGRKTFMSPEERAMDYEEAVLDIATSILNGTDTSCKNLSFQIHRYTSKLKDCSQLTPKVEVVLTRAQALVDLLIDCSVMKIGSLGKAMREQKIQSLVAKQIEIPIELEQYLVRLKLADVQDKPKVAMELLFPYVTGFDMSEDFDPLMPRAAALSFSDEEKALFAFCSLFFCL